MATLKYRDPGTGQFVPLSSGGPPVGAIVAYTGATPPNGWFICDGSTHGSTELQTVIGTTTTPDLKDRFVVGAGTTMPAQSTGGAATVTLTGAQTGTTAHTHTASTGGDSASHTHPYASAAAFSHKHTNYHANYTGYYDLSNTAGGEPAALGAQNVFRNYVSQGAHTHTGTSGGVSANHTHTMSANASTANATAAHENLPPFYAMVYIIFGG